VRKTNGRWETPTLWIGLGAGAAMGIVAVVIELWLTRALQIKETPTLGSAAYQAFAIAAIPEEVVKFIALLAITIVYLEGRRLQDVLLVAVGIGMGFAGLENIAYVAGSRAWELTAIIRAVSAVPTHGVLALTMGALVIATVLNEGNRWLGLTLALVVPILLHGAYDTLLMISDPGAKVWAFPATVVVMTLSGVVAVVLCNMVLPQAAALDEPPDSKPRRLPRGNRKLAPPGNPKLLSRLARGFLFVLVGVAWLSGFQPAVSWFCAFLGVLPLILSFDLLATRIGDSGAGGTIRDLASHA
jgi:hypothetical protein